MSDAEDFAWMVVGLCISVLLVPLLLARAMWEFVKHRGK